MPAKLQLDPHQKEGVAFLTKFKGRALLADDQGLGKTIQALWWIKSTPDCFPVLIVSPAIAKDAVWESETVKWLGIRPLVLSGRDASAQAVTPADKIVLINYDILHEWAGVLAKAKFNTLVMDEAHYISNYESKRYAGMRRLAVSTRRKKQTVYVLGKAKSRKVVTASSKIKYVIGLTGTPITNSPKDLWGIVSIIWPHEFPHPYSFLWRYTKPQRFRGGFIYKEPRKLKELHERLFKLGTLRRLKTKVMQGIPAKKRKTIEVAMSKSDRREYAEIVDHFLVWMRRNHGRGKAARAARAQQFAQLQRLIRFTTRAKVEAIIEWITDFRVRNPKEKLVVASYNRPLLEGLEAHFGTSCSIRIDGSVPPKERKPRVQQFQTNPGKWLALCNGKAAGVAITLTASRFMLGTDFPWSPSVMLQMEDRIHRRGQTGQVIIHYMVARDTIEEVQLKKLAEKQVMIDKVMQGEVRESGKDLVRMHESVRKAVLSHVACMAHASHRK